MDFLQVPQLDERRKSSLVDVPRFRTTDVFFEDVFLTVPDKKGYQGKKHVINGVSGLFRSGELTAIMGPSGAGKTSLLNILTGFQTRGIEGVVISKMGNRTRVGAQQYKKDSCYILQDDQLAPLFTVYETMKIAADLKLGHSISEKSKHYLIQDILDTLGLATTHETRCLRLSGGQKKRLSIALELIDNPPIMFLDEPTTGLDSSASLMCISMLKKLARGGRTIICTIHQPSATLYEMFDHVYVMAEGKCVYQGASRNTVEYLASVGFNCPQYHNPADYLLEVANGEYGQFTETLAKAATETKWRKDVKRAVPKLHNLERQETNISIRSIAVNDNNGDKTEILVSPTSEWLKLIILINRAFVQIYRDWTVSHLKLGLHLLIGCFVGVTFMNTGNDASKTVSNIAFLLVGIVYLCYTSLMPAVLRFPAELAVLKKERFNNWYRLKTYYTAFLVADIPMQIIFSLAYTSVSYFITEQPRETERFFMVLLILTLVAITASSVGLVLGTTVSPVNGTFLGAILHCFMVCLSGFLILFTHMSKFMYILSYASYLGFALEAVVQSVYGFNRGPIHCPEEELICLHRLPKALLKDVGMEHNNYWIDVAYLVCTIVAMRTLAFFTLKRSLSPN